jgi:hypothetical protein
MRHEGHQLQTCQEHGSNTNIQRLQHHKSNAARERKNMSIPTDGDQGHAPPMRAPAAATGAPLRPQQWWPWLSSSAHTRGGNESSPAPYDDNIRGRPPPCVHAAAAGAPPCLRRQRPTTDLGDRGWGRMRDHG